MRRVIGLGRLVNLSQVRPLQCHGNRLVNLSQVQVVSPMHIARVQCLWSGSALSAGLCKLACDMRGAGFRECSPLCAIYSYLALVQWLMYCAFSCWWFHRSRKLASMMNPFILAVFAVPMGAQIEEACINNGPNDVGVVSRTQSCLDRESLHQ